MNQNWEYSWQVDIVHISEYGPDDSGVHIARPWAHRTKSHIQSNTTESASI